MVLTTFCITAHWNVGDGWTFSTLFNLLSKYSARQTIMITKVGNRGGTNALHVVMSLHSLTTSQLLYLAKKCDFIRTMMPQICPYTVGYEMMWHHSRLKLALLHIFYLNKSLNDVPPGKQASVKH